MVCVTLLGILQNVLEFTQQTKLPEKKISPNVSPAPFGQKQMATPTLQTSCYFVCYNAACRV